MTVVAEYRKLCESFHKCTDPHEKSAIAKRLRELLAKYGGLVPRF